MKGQGMKLFRCKTTQHIVNSFDMFNKILSIFEKILWHIDPLLGNDREMRQQPLLCSGALSNGTLLEAVFSLRARSEAI
jgi:hypothetical protein